MLGCSSDRGEVGVVVFGLAARFSKRGGGRGKVSKVENDDKRLCRELIYNICL